MGGEEISKKIKLRKYQKNIVKNILKRGNTLVVLPTGTGKTIIAFYLMLLKKEGFFLAPTKPLVKQHFSNFVTLFPDLKDKVIILTGEIKKEKRKENYEKSFVFATPQTIEKDIKREIAKLNKKLFVFDECHRAVGKYSYSEIAKKIKNSLIVGLTASPGGKEEKIKEVMSVLNISNIEIRTGKEEDIREYVFKKKYKWVFISLSPDLRRAVNNVKNLIKKEREWFLKHKIRVPQTKTELISFRKRIEEIPKPLYYQTSTHFSILFNLNYMREILETQGFHYFLNYVEKIKERKTKAARLLLSNPLIKENILLATKNKEENKYPPKFYKLIEIIEKNKGKKMIIFLQYIDTINLLFDFLNKKDVPVFKFMGKRKGFNKKEQQKIIEQFRKSEASVLPSSSVGEEGIDIPSVDVVVFFDVVPSEIRSIQRKGRAGRVREGEVYFIITMNTMEVAFYRAAIRREKTMKQKMIEFKKKREIKEDKEEKRKEKERINNEIKIKTTKKQTNIFDYL